MKIDFNPSSMKPEQWALCLSLFLLAAAGAYRIFTDSLPEPVSPRTTGPLPEFRAAAEFENKAEAIAKPEPWKPREHAVFIPRLIVFYPDSNEIGALQMEDKGPDGIPFEWKRRFGFPLDDPTVAGADPDGDGFTNLEEFLRGTDPTDPASSPPFIEKLCVREFNPVSLSIIFRGYNPDPQNPGSYEFQINLPEARSQRSRRVRPGDTIEGYIVGDFREKIVQRENPRTGIVETINESELDVKDPRLDKVITLILNQVATSDESNVEFDLKIPRATLEPARVSIGGKFKAQDKEFQLRSASEAGATIRDLATGEDIQVPRCGAKAPVAPAPEPQGAPAVESGESPSATLWPNRFNLTDFCS
ncbi:MAG: Amuc_1099 family pilus-like system protein [Verrucomicrobiia bacterium]